MASPAFWIAMIAIKEEKTQRAALVIPMAMSNKVNGNPLNKERLERGGQTIGNDKEHGMQENSHIHVNLVNLE